MSGRLFISMRYRRAHFDANAAQEFMNLYKDVLFHAR